MQKWLKYLNIPHHYEGINCITILEKIYLEELGIDFSFERDQYKLIGSSIRDLISTNINVLNNLPSWRPISILELQEFDILIFGRKNYMMHFGLYIGNNRYIHLPENSVSHISELNESNRAILKLCLRHKRLDT